MLLEIKNLDISYGGNVPTVQDVNISLAAGEVLAIVGESGSGKTSVIRAILGVLPGSGRISRGEITFAGQDLSQLSDAAWRQLRGREIAMIFQDSGSMMNPVQTIGHQFREYLQTHRAMQAAEADEMARELLGRMHLPDPDSVMASYTFELSGGMRQRVGIAMAIAFQPQLLLADEPTSALDVTTQAQIVRELMQVVRASGTALVMVTHNIGVAACMADKMMVMAGGKVMEYGPAASILENPQTEYTRTLLAAVPEIGGVRYV